MAILYAFRNFDLRRAMVPKTITLTLSAELGREIELRAKKERCTAKELVHEAIRQYCALRTLRDVAAKARKLVKKKGLTEKDFGGPFAK